MTDRAIQIKVGILVLLSILLLVLFIFVLGDIRVVEEQTLYIDFKTSAGLKTGAPLKIAGVSAGKVREVTYRGPQQGKAEVEGALVRVRATVASDMAATLHRNARFYITTLGMLGEKYIEVDPGSADAPLLEEEQIVRGEQPFQLEVMSANINRLVGTLTRLTEENEGRIASILDNANVALKEVAVLVKENRPTVDRALGRIDRITEDTQAVMAGLRVAVGDGSEIRSTVRDARATLSNAKAISRSVRGRTGRILEGVGKVIGGASETLDIYKALGQSGRDQVDAVMEKAKGILAKVDAVAADLRAGKGVVGALLQDPELYDDIKEMMRDLKRHPWKILWKE